MIDRARGRQACLWQDPAPMPITVAITGATGFLGGALCRTFRARGFRVRAIVRRAVALPDADEVRRASLVASPALTAALDGSDVVVHCAGGGRAVTAEDFRRNNLDTTLAIDETIAALARKPVQLVLVSSIAAGGPDGNGPAALTATTCTARSSYGRHKWLAEREVLAFGERMGGAVQVTIVRAPAIYGPGDDRFAPLIRAARRGWLVAPSPDSPLSMVDVDDAASAIVSTVERRPSGPRLQFVEDGQRYSARRLSAALARHFGRELRAVRVPVALLRAVAAAEEARARLTARSAFLTRDKVRDLTAPSWLCDSASLRAETGWRPLHTFESRVPAIVAASARTASDT